MARELRHTVCLLEVKSIDDGRRRISGVASTPTPDRHGDILEPAGATFAAEIPLLLHHRKETPVGVARLFRRAEAIEFEAELPTIEQPGAVRDEVERAWTSITSRPPLIRGVSIGHLPKGGMKSIELRKEGGFRFRETEICELSLVTVPANSEATLAIVAALDREYQAALGLPPSPGVSGRPRTEIRSMSAAATHTTAEQISAFEASRAADSARMVALMQASAARGESLDEAEADEYDGLERKVASTDKHLVRLRALEKAQLVTAAAVPANANGRGELERRTTVVSVRPNVPQGMAFVRKACAMIVCRGNRLEAAEYARGRWKDSTPEVELELKAAVAPGTTTDPAWAGALVNPTTSTDFVELLRPATAIGKIVGLREVMFNTKVPAQTGGGTYGWVGEGKPKPVTKLAFSSVTIPPTKVAGIIVITRELAKLSNPKAEEIIRRDMIAGIAKFLDQQLLDPAVAAIAGVRPASLTNGVTPITSTGSALGDIVALASAFSTANVPLEQLTLIMSPTNALVLSFTQNAQGGAAFPGMSGEGGSVNGVKVVTSAQAGTNVIGVVPPLVLYADDGSVEIDVSEEASLELSDAPMSPQDATTVMVSLWQNNLVGLRAERGISWLKAHADSVKFVSGATYTIPAALQAGAAGAAPVTNGKRER